MCDKDGKSASKRIMNFCKQSPELMANIVYELIASWNFSNVKGRVPRQNKVLTTVKDWLVASHPYYESKLTPDCAESYLKKFSMDLLGFYLDEENRINRIEDLNEPCSDFNRKVEKIMGANCLARFRAYNREQESDLKQHLCAYRMLEAVAKAVEEPVYAESYPKGSRTAQAKKRERICQVLANVYLLSHCREMAFPLEYLDFSKGLNVVGDYVHRAVQYADFLHRRTDSFEFKDETIYDHIFQDISLVVRDKIIVHTCGYCGLICCGSGRAYCNQKCSRRADKRKQFKRNRMEAFDFWIDDRLTSYEGALDEEKRRGNSDVDDIEEHIRLIQRVKEAAIVSIHTQVCDEQGNAHRSVKNDYIYILARIMANINQKRWDELNTFVEGKNIGCLKKYLEEERGYYPMFY